MARGAFTIRHNGIGGQPCTNRAFPGDTKGSNTSLIAGIVFETIKRYGIDDPFTDERHVVKAEAAGTIVGMAVPQVVFSGYALVHVARN